MFGNLMDQRVAAVVELQCVRWEHFDRKKNENCFGSGHELI